MCMPSTIEKYNPVYKRKRPSLSDGLFHVWLYLLVDCPLPTGRTLKELI